MMGATCSSTASPHSVDCQHGRTPTKQALEAVHTQLSGYDSQIGRLAEATRQLGANLQDAMAATWSNVFQQSNTVAIPSVVRLLLAYAIAAAAVGLILQQKLLRADQQEQVRGRRGGLRNTWRIRPVV